MAMNIRARIAVAAGLVTLMAGGATSALAIAPSPQCVRDCSPVQIDTTGPCYGVTVGNKSIDNICYLGPPPPAL